ncbi:MAG: hypothetical protein ABJO01_15265 [Parasphingorhabdus sp.]
MQDILVDVYADSTLIGTSKLYQLNRDTGFASGTFVAAEPYDEKLHATVLEGDYLGPRASVLKIQTDGHGWMECDAIAIHDFSNLLGEIEINLCGLIAPA